MRLAELILEELQPILADFEEFARTHTAAGASMDTRALRDHAEDMLRALVIDIGTAQTDAEQRAKAEGDAPVVPGSALTAAEKHGHDRAGSGFTLPEMFAEYRALRASVMRHWLATRKGRLEPDLEDMIRFNEAIDQAVAESIMRYAATVGEYREMFLAVLGHDLRTPLSAVLTASEHLSEQEDISPRGRQLAGTIRRSGNRMNALVDDLLDFTLTRLGRGIPIERRRSDLALVVREVADEVRVLHPDRQFRFETAGDLVGDWDSGRIGQALSNLVSNAVQHGAPDSAITIVALRQGEEVIVSVRNRGRSISDAEIEHIFEPFRRNPTPVDGEHGRRSLGLGLYIARQIVSAHEGVIEVDSSPERGTTFTIRLPRSARADSSG